MSICQKINIKFLYFNYNLSNNRWKNKVWNKIAKQIVDV